MTHVTKDDVIDRINRRKRHWFHGRPKVYLEGESGEFGRLSLDFGDEIVSWRLYIDNKQEILDLTECVVLNFALLQVECDEKMR